MSNRAAPPPLSRACLLAAVVCAGAALILWQFFGNATRGYVNTSSLFWWWVSQWLDPNAEAQHGWLILGLSGWLFWRNLRSAEPRPAGTESNTPHFTPRVPVAALAAMVGGLGLHAVGFAAQQSRISILALLVFTWGVLRLAGGRRWGNAALFPLGFMVFAIPVSMLDEIGLPLRVWVTGAGERIAHAAGIDVVRSGTQLVAPDGRFNYDVAAPCSGVRSLMALSALSLLVGYLTFGSWWRRLLGLALCFPLVYVGNVARIVAIVFAAQWGGTEWGERAHEVMGYGVFAIVLGGELAFVAAIQRWWPEAAPNRARLPHATGAGHAPGADSTAGDAVAAPRVATRAAGRAAAGPDRENGARPTETDLAPRATVLAGDPVPERISAPLYNKHPWAIAGLVAGLAAAEMAGLRALANAPPRGGVGVVLAADGLNPVELPTFLGTDWLGQRAEISAVEREILPPDTGFSRKSYAYVPDRRHDVFLSIVLSGRDRTSIHRPELCLVGQGWTIERAVQHAFRLAREPGPAPTSAAGTFPATVLRIRREVPTPRGKVVLPHLVAYWFVGGDTVTSSHWGRFVYDTWNRVARGRADRWAYVLIQTNAADGEAAALARMQVVLDATLPEFQRPRLAL